MDKIGTKEVPTVPYAVAHKSRLMPLLIPDLSLLCEWRMLFGGWGGGGGGERGVFPDPPRCSHFFATVILITDSSRTQGKA